MTVPPPAFYRALEQFGRCIRAAREHRTWTQAMLARQSGVNISTISLCERGLLRANLRVETFVRLVNALHLDPHETLQPFLTAMSLGS